MGGRVAVVRARKLRPGMVLHWPSVFDEDEVILEVRAGWVRVDYGWYWLWAILDRLRDGTAVLK